MPNITKVRRANAVALFQQFAHEHLAAGDPAKGLEQAFAAELEISPSMWSQVKASRPISDKLARQIEHHMKRQTGWLDEPRAEESTDAAEERFIALARTAWRAAKADQKRALLRALKGD